MFAWAHLRRRLCALTATTAVTTGLAACVRDAGPSPKTGTGTVRYVNASADAGVLNVMLDKAVAVANLPFLADTPLSVSSGAHSLAVTASAPSATSIPATAVAVTPGAIYDFIVAGAATGATPTLQLIGGGPTPPPSVNLATLAAFRLYNAVADTGAAFGSGAVDVYFTDATGAFATAKYAFAGLALFASPLTSANGNGIYFAVVPGTYHVKVTAPGDTTTVAVDSTWMVIAGQVRTVIAAPSANQASGNLVLIRDAN
jgi:uncharacterized protein DUF4397